MLESLEEDGFDGRHGFRDESTFDVSAEVNKRNTCI